MKVKSCQFWKQPHNHTSTVNGVRCEVANQIVEETQKPIDIKTLKAAWFPKKTKHQLKEEKKEAAEALD